MSNRRKVKRTHPLTEWAASLDGARIPGGCNDCDAFQTFHTLEPNLTNVRVHHHACCPTYRRMQNR